MGQPLLSHWQSIKKTLGYLKGAVDYGLVLQPYARHQPYNLHAYCDADWASDIEDRRSTSGACLFLGANLCVLRSKLW